MSSSFACLNFAVKSVCLALWRLSTETRLGINGGSFCWGPVWLEKLDDYANPILSFGDKIERPEQEFWHQDWVSRKKKKKTTWSQSFHGVVSIVMLIQVLRVFTPWVAGWYTHSGNLAPWQLLDWWRTKQVNGLVKDLVPRTAYNSVKGMLCLGSNQPTRDRCVRVNFNPCTFCLCKAREQHFDRQCSWIPREVYPQEISRSGTATLGTPIPWVLNFNGSA